MRKTLAIVIVCLLLTIFGGTAAMAEAEETIITVTCTPGAAFADNTELNQLLDISALRIHAMPEGYGAVVLTLGDMDAISALLRVEEEGIYVQSQMFGKSPLYFSWEDLKALVMEQLEEMPAEYSTDMGLNPEMLQMMLDGTMTQEQMFAMMGIDDALLAFVADIEASKTVETGAFSLNGSDVADQKTVIVLDAEDVAAAMNLPIVRQMLVTSMQAEDASASPEEVDAYIDAMIAEINQTLDEGEFAITCTLYMNDDELVAMNMELSVVADDETNRVVAMLTKTSIDQAAFYQLSLNIYEGEETIMNQYASLYLSDEFISGKVLLNSFDNEPMLSMILNCDLSAADYTSGEFALTYYDAYSDDAQSMLALFDQVRGDKTSDTEIDLFFGSGTVDDLKADLANSSLLSFAIGTVTQPDSGFFADLQSATPEGSVQMLQMTEDELAAYSEALQQSMMITLMTMMQNLPPDISEVLMESMMSGSF